MPNRPVEMLMVDDEPQIRALVIRALNGPTRRCVAVSSGRDAIKLLCDRPFDVIVSDICMPEMTGLELMTQAQAVRPECRVVLISGVGTATMAKQAIRQGAFDFIEKPFDLDQLARVVDAAAASNATPPATWAAFDDGNATGTRDALTGLLNHRCFVEELGQLRAQGRRNNRPVSVLMVDIDEFRVVNEKYGRARGDLLLREVAARVKAAARESDIAARYAWDQFALALPETSEEAARVVATRCLQAVSQPIDCGSQPVPCAISIGLAECEGGFIENETHLLRRAAEALTEAKARGGSIVVSWSELAGQDGEGPRPDLPGLKAMRREFQRVQAQLKQAYLESTRALVAAVEAKDPYTEKHSVTVSHYATSFARHLGLPAEMVEAIATAAILHDVGKIGIPDSVLTKPGRLTKEETLLVQRHPGMGIQILEHISFLRAELPIILHHHERYDGSGYPAGLAGEEIPLGARILNLADSLDAMLSVRSYKTSYPLDHVIREIRRCAGTQFDPVIAPRVIEWIESHSDQIIHPRERATLLPRVLSAQTAGAPSA